MEADSVNAAEFRFDTNERLAEIPDLDGATGPGGRVRMGDLTIDLDGRTVRGRDGSTVTLQEKPFLLLLSLLRRPGRLVTREELVEALWPPGLHVDFDHGLNTAVKKLRQALDDSAREPRYVETIPKRGYRLLLEAHPIEFGEDSRPIVERPVLELPVPAGRRAWRGAGELTALLALASLTMLHSPWIELTPETEAASQPPSPEAMAERGISLAVIPLRNLDASEEGEYFVEGLTEEIVTALGARAPDSLHLIASSSTLRFRSTELPADVIGAALGVDYLVTGSLRRDGDRSRVSLQVVHAATREQRWSTSYDLDGEDVLAMQSQIARGLIQAIPDALEDPAPELTMRTRSLAD